MSNFIFHELSIQKIIELLLSFNRSIKPATRFLTKAINMIYCIHCTSTTPWGQF